MDQRSAELKHHSLYFLLIICCVTVCLFLSTPCYSKETVTGKYISIAKNQVEFIVNIGNRKPTSLIVQHFHPANIKLKDCVPQTSKINNKKGFAKWFLKDVKTGPISFFLSFNKFIPKKSIKIILRYRDPVTGKFVESQILPPANL